ncbi:MAG: 5-formyltetrahydrofolate cyclo-ligase [Oscillospiraceae bacterium]|jgi:5-formyltetrahydrofolate cyclo-ligase|nr:5-formyltetrahydrofolate cyclo-ligase [Oscillospiraceae bacterium]
MTKADWRARFAAARAALAPDEAARQARAVTELVLAWPLYRAARTVLLYAPLGGELDTSALLDAALAQGKALALPRCGASGRMDAAPVTNWRGLARGALGILSPPGDAPALPPRVIDLVLIPGVGFDAHGMRLGRGGGYYDRYLPGCAYPKAGLAFACQTVSALPREPHDAGVDYIITFQGILPAKK